MTNKQYRLSGLKHQLSQSKDAGKSEVVKRLNDEQRRYVEEVLAYQTKPWLYEITTKSINHVSDVKNSLIRAIHYANKRGQKKIYKKLKIKEISVLDEHHVSYRRFKDKIIL